MDVVLECFLGRCCTLIVFLDVDGDLLCLLQGTMQIKSSEVAGGADGLVFMINCGDSEEDVPCSAVLFAKNKASRLSYL